MAYNKFTLTSVKQKLGVDNHIHNFLPKTFADFNVSEQLLNELADVEGVAIASEKAKSELIVMPIVKELKRHNKDKFSYFSGYKFNVDSKKGLTGFCDILFSAEPYKQEIEAPVFYIVEAKNDLLEAGFGQCAAEMIAAQLFNEKQGHPRKVIYGCVTNAFTWCFLKLENNSILIDSSHIPLTLTEPHKVLATLQWILDQFNEEQTIVPQKSDK